MRKRKSLLVLVGAVVLLLGLSIPMMQCAPSGEEVTPPPEEEVTPPEEEVTPPEEEEIKYGGRLNVGWRPAYGMETLICDSTWQYTAMGCMFWQLIYDQLWIMGPAPDYEVLPMLATSWESEDGKTWTFHLREDAVFHDGVPVTAEDVAFTIWHLPRADPTWSFPDCMCESYPTVIDDYTVQFTLETTLGGTYPPCYWVPMFPKHIWEPYKGDMTSFTNDEAIGSGPFKLREFKPAEYIWFVANEDYWGERPYVDEVVFRVYGSDDALYMALEIGEIDMDGYDGCSALVVDSFKEGENTDVIVSPGIGVEWLSFNLHKDGPLQDLNVRKAIMHGIDKDRLIGVVSWGYAERVDSFVYPELADHNPNLPQYDYDPDLANKILDDAGYIDTDGDGIRNDPATVGNLAFGLIVASDWIDEVKMSTLIVEQLKDIGIDIIMKALDDSTFYSYIYAPNSDLYDIGFMEEEPGPYADWVWQFCRSWEIGSWNTAYYVNPEFDEVLDKYLAEGDAAKRREYLYEMQMMLAEDLPYGFMVRPDIMNPVNTGKFEGYVATMGGISTWINPWTYYKVHLK